VALTPHTSGASHAGGTDAVLKFCPTLVVHPTLVVLTPLTSTGEIDERNLKFRNVMGILCSCCQLLLE